MKTSVVNNIVVGLLIAILSIIGGFFLEGGKLSMLFLFPAFLIVAGGTIAAGIIGHSVGHIAYIPKLIRVAMRPSGVSLQETIEQLYTFSVLSRRDGFIQVERNLQSVQHPLLRKLLSLVVDGATQEDLRSTAETEMMFIGERHKKNIQLFVKLGGYSPTMGIIGTVMGLITTLAGVGSDPNDLIRHIASAFIATFWGIFLANTIWLPVADKLKLLHEEEMTLFEVFLEGALGIQRGDNPTMLRARLAGVLPLAEQTAYLTQPKTQA